MWYTIADTGTWDLIASVPGDQSITGTQCMIVMLHAFRYVYSLRFHDLYGRHMHEPKQWYAQFSGTRNSKSQNTRSEKV